MTSEEKKEKHGKTIEGVVVRRSGEKTVMVQTTTVSRHAVYGKKTTRSKRYLVHDPDNKAVIGKQVTIKESRPISRHKRWVLVK